ncbi:efflux RND transporter permease subunit [candidate division WOR-3 bacterium]|nr:efflux RND transporter permease subunit [candidate division WOR-3 bacterium]
MIEGAVKRPVLTTVVFLVLIIFGIIGWVNLPIALYPDIDLPFLIVFTVYPGASALDIEEEVTKEVEDALGTVTGLKKVTSNSSEDFSVVYLEFEYGVDLDVASNDARDALSFAELPDNADDPILFKISSSMAPILIITAATENPGIDIKKIVEEKISISLSRIEGVGSAPIWGGGEDRQVNINVSATKLEQLGLSLNQIVQTLQATNLDFPLGAIERGNTRYSLRLPAKFKKIDDIRNVVVGERDDKPIHLEDIAEVELGTEDIEGYYRTNEKEAVILGIQRKSGANIVEVADKVKERIKTLEQKYPGIDINVVIDLSDFVRSSIDNLVRTISIAILLVLIISFLFLGNIRASLIIATVIPTSLIISFVYLYLSGGTLNIVSLSAIAIAVGMVVDNAVVVLENIFRHREAGESRREASIFGAQEVGQAILASTITTVAIFLPLLLTRGFVSIMFKELAITIPLMLIISLITATTLSPMLSSRFLKISRDENFSDRFFRKLEKGYSGMIGWSIGNKGKLVGIFIIIFIIGMFLFKFVPMDFFPKSDTGQIEAEMELPTGMKAERTNEIAKEVEELIRREVPGVNSITTSVGASGSVFGGSAGPNISSIYIDIGERERTTSEIAATLEEKAREIPGIKRIEFSVTGGLGEMGFGGSDIEVQILGDELMKTDSLAILLKEKFLSIPGIKSIEISRKQGGRELWLVPRSEAMYSYGLSPYWVGSQLRTAFYGTEIGKYSISGIEYPIMVRLDDDSRNSMNTIENFQITNPVGDLVYISNFLKLEERRGPIAIERKNNERMVSLNISTFGRALGDVGRDVRRVVNSTILPSDIIIEYGGTIEEQGESQRSLMIAIAFGILLVFLVMAAQFESFLDPFIIMFSIPFAFVGVSLGYFVSFQSMTLMGMVGIALLVGIVVNNAIVMIDYINILRKRGMELYDAIITGASRRLRPILMTTGTTVFGLLPLALSRGSGSGLWRSLGISAVGGMVVASFITLLLIPTLYAIVEGKIKRRMVK